MSDSIDVSQVRALAVDLGKAGASVTPQIRGVIAKGALNIKNDLRRQARGSGIAEARALASFISYGMTGPMSAEIGPSDRGGRGPKRGGSAGSMAFLYFGNSKNGPVLPDPGDSLTKEAPKIERYIAKIIDGAL